MSSLTASPDIATLADGSANIGRIQKGEERLWRYFRMPKPNLDLAAFNTQISIKREVGRIHKFNPQSVDPLVDANDSWAEVIRCSEPIRTERFDVFCYSTFPVNQ
jgi:hypothetical protein